MFSLSHLKQTKVDQEAIKEGREEGQQRGKLPAKFRLYYPRYCLRLRQGKGARSSLKLPKSLSVIGQFYETNSLRHDDSFYL